MDEKKRGEGGQVRACLTRSDATVEDWRSSQQRHETESD